MVKINSLEIENIKRVKAVRMKPNPNGLTIIGGNNNQGKTSVLDAIAWVLGGDKHKPSDAKRDESLIPPILHVELDNGLIVERKGKNSDLKVIDPQGNKSGQQLLNKFIEQLALDLPKFLQANNKEKADTLLQIIGVGDELYKLDNQIEQKFSRRTEIGRIADQKKKYAEELMMHPGLPKEPISALELIQKQQSILAQNGENQRKRDNINYYNKELAEAQTAFEKAKERLSEAEKNAETARKSVLDLHDEGTEELEKSINNIDNLNIKIRANLDKEKAEIDAEGYQKEYDGLSTEINDLRKKRSDLLKSANLPLPQLSVEDGELTYEGKKWDSMSGSDQLKVATAIVRKINPDCQFVLMDKLEQMDTNTLTEFGAWLEQEGLQVIATRVSTGKECSLIIEDGYVKDDEPQPIKSYKAGEF